MAYCLQGKAVLLMPIKIRRVWPCTCWTALADQRNGALASGLLPYSSIPRCTHQSAPSQSYCFLFRDGRLFVCDKEANLAIFVW